MKIKNLLGQQENLTKKIDIALENYAEVVEKETGFELYDFFREDEDSGFFCYVFTISSGVNAKVFLNLDYRNEVYVEPLEKYLEWGGEDIERDFTKSEIKEIEKIYKIFKRLE